MPVRPTFLSSPPKRHCPPRPRQAPPQSLFKYSRPRNGAHQRFPLQRERRKKRRRRRRRRHRSLRRKRLRLQHHRYAVVTPQQSTDHHTARSRAESYHTQLLLIVRYRLRISLVQRGDRACVESKHYILFYCVCREVSNTLELISHTHSPHCPHRHQQRKRSSQQLQTPAPQSLLMTPRKQCLLLSE